MNKYYITNENIDLKYYPNYSFEIGDVDGDGRMEFLSMDHTATLLSVHNLKGELLFERSLDNTGSWGTALIGVADIDGNGRDEIIVPDGEYIVAFDGEGNKIREYKHNATRVDGYGISVPLIGAARIKSLDEWSIVACIAGGIVVALDSDFNKIWKVDGFLNDYGHEIFIADVDGDGLDEICFSSVTDSGRGPEKVNVGEQILLDHDGTVMLRKRVESFYEYDNHFDDIAMADFLGDGTCQILLEKGILIDLKGNVIWDISNQFAHGQWIAHTPNPNGKGELVFISELWGDAMKSMLFTGDGKKIKDIGGMPWPVFNTAEQKAMNATPLPSRCHVVKWGGTESSPEFFLTQQAHVSGSPETFSFELVALFIDERGNLVGKLPFTDSRIKGYFYNGEVHSRVADVDGDGEQEIVFTKQDGHVMIIKKKI